MCSSDLLPQRSPQPRLLPPQRAPITEGFIDGAEGDVNLRSEGNVGDELAGVLLAALDEDVEGLEADFPEEGDRKSVV